jgi:hypothetical protein
MKFIFFVTEMQACTGAARPVEGRAVEHGCIAASAPLQPAFQFAKSRDAFCRATAAKPKLIKK